MSQFLHRFDFILYGHSCDFSNQNSVENTCHKGYNILSLSIIKLYIKYIYIIALITKIWNFPPVCIYTCFTIVSFYYECLAAKLH